LDILATIDEYIACADWTGRKPVDCCSPMQPGLILLPAPGVTARFEESSRLPFFKTNWRLCGEESRWIADLLSGILSIAAGHPLQRDFVIRSQSLKEFSRFLSHGHVLVPEGGCKVQDVLFIFL
jgi:hypothetical protein